LCRAYQVELRTQELRNTNNDLNAQIAQRRILEREIQEVSNRTMQAIGQDLHDDLCQHLVGISMLAAVVEETLATTSSVSVDSIREIRTLLESAVSRSRQFARTLYPPGLEAQGLVSALEDLVESQRHTACSVSISLQVEGDCRRAAPERLQLPQPLRHSRQQLCRGLPLLRGGEHLVDLPAGAPLVTLGVLGERREGEEEGRGRGSRRTVATSSAETAGPAAAAESLWKFSIAAFASRILDVSASSCDGVRPCSLLRHSPTASARGSGESASCCPTSASSAATRLSAAATAALLATLAAAASWDTKSSYVT